MLRKKIKPGDQLKFLKSLGFLLSLEGMVLKKALIKMVKKEAGMVSRTAEQILDAINEGGDTYEAMGRFDDRIRSMIAIGEQTNNLKGGIQSAIEFLARDVKVSSGAGFAMVMPAIMFISQAAILSLIATKILPQFEGAIPRTNWPGTTLFVSALGSAIASYWYLMLAVLLAYPAAFYAKNSAFSGPARARLDTLGLPLWGRYRTVCALQFLTVLLSLLKTNSDPILLSCLGAMQKHATPYVRWHLALMMEASGAVAHDGLASIMTTGLLEEEDLDRIRVASEGKSMVGAVAMALSEKIDDLEVADKKAALVMASAVGTLNTIMSLLIIFSTAPLALSIQGI